MSHKKNEFSEGGVNVSRQSSTSSQASNPWGVSLNKLSFKQSQIPKNVDKKNPYHYIGNNKSKSKLKNKSSSAAQRNSHTYEKSDIIPPQAFSPSNLNNKPIKKAKKKSIKKDNKKNIKKDNKKDNKNKIKTKNQNKNQNNVVDDKKRKAERTKKRKLRRQLSLAKMQMSVLKARLGLEQMNNTPVPSVVSSSHASHTPSISSLSSHDDDNVNHLRSPSASTENLFATIESMGNFENDIKNAITKVDDLMKQVNDDNDVKQSNNELELVKENQKLKNELNDIKKKFDALKKENQSLKHQKTGSVAAISNKINKKIDKDNKSNSNNNNPSVPAPAKQDDYKPDPMEKYTKMKELGMSVDAITTKMGKSGIEQSKIDEWKKKMGSQSADQKLASNINAKEQLYEKYDKMKKLGMNEFTIRNKMKMDGFKPDEINNYLNSAKQAEQAAKNAKYAKYDRMKKFMPENAIRNKMKVDGIPLNEIEEYLNPKKDDDDDNKPKVDLSKYERMKKMGMPAHAISNKMRLDGIPADVIQEFENPGSTKKNKKKKVKATDPRLAKYERMKKMGMPIHAIVNKMRLDGMPKSLIHKFEHHTDDDDDDDDESSSEEEDDPNAANEIDLNIPALKKYHRMVKMGMPKHAIVNKMKLDGIDKNIIEQFENPAPKGGKKKKKKRGIGGLFHKRKTSIPPKAKITPTVDMKRFHWQTVDYKLARNSIWKTMNESTVTKNMDTKEFESLFSIPKKENKLKSLFGKNKDDKKEKAKVDQIKFVSAKRQYNVELLLKRLKFDGAKLCNNIVIMNENVLNIDLLIKISDMVPSDEEQQKAIAMSNNGDNKTIAKFPIVERFFYDLSSIWSLQERVKLWIFKKEFSDTIQDKIDRISQLNAALTAIQGSEGLYEIFRVVLAFGNYMNGGRRNGQAYGFSLQTLRMLSGTKGTDGKTTLLMYIYKHCKNPSSGSSVGANVVKELEIVRAAMRIDIDSLEKAIKATEIELKKLPKRLKEFDKNNKKIKKDIFYKNMIDWSKTANNTITELKQQYKEMNDRAHMLAETFAYKINKDDGGVHGFLKIFGDFINDWNKASVKYTRLEEQKKKELKRKKNKEAAQKRLQEKLAKRKIKKKDLEKKNILKSKEKVEKELKIKEKLQKTMKAHIRKQTEMQKMFADVLQQSDEEDDDDDNDDNTPRPYDNYLNNVTSHNNNNNGIGIQSFNPDMYSQNVVITEQPEPDADMRQNSQKRISNISNATVRFKDDNVSRQSPVSSLDDIMSQNSLFANDNPSLIPVPGSGSPIGDDDPLTRSMSARPRDKKDKPALNKTKSQSNIKGGNKKRKKKNDKSHNQTPHDLNQQLHKFRGKGNYNPNNPQSQKYDYASSGGIFNKRHAVPVATQFGNVWERNFSPLSRSAYSRTGKQTKKKPKKVKYKSGHVRRETRLKKAFEALNKKSLSKINLDDLHKDISDNDNNGNKSPTKNRKVKSPKSVKIKTPTSPTTTTTTRPTSTKAKGKDLYSKYKKNKSKRNAVTGDF